MTIEQETFPEVLLTKMSEVKETGPLPKNLLEFCKGFCYADGELEFGFLEFSFFDETKVLPVLCIHGSTVLLHIKLLLMYQGG